MRSRATTSPTNAAMDRRSKRHGLGAKLTPTCAMLNATEWSSHKPWRWRSFGTRHTPWLIICLGVRALTLTPPSSIEPDRYGENPADRKSDESGKKGSVSVEPGRRRIHKKKKNKK